MQRVVSRLRCLCQNPVFYGRTVVSFLFLIFLFFHFCGSNWCQYVTVFIKRSHYSVRYLVFEPFYLSAGQTCLSDYLSVCCLSACLSVGRFACLSICLPDCLSMMTSFSDCLWWRHSFSTVIIEFVLSYAHTTRLRTQKQTNEHTHTHTHTHFIKMIVRHGVCGQLDAEQDPLNGLFLFDLVIIIDDYCTALSLVYTNSLCFTTFSNSF